MTIFDKIINGEIPCHRLAEDDRFLSFLDISPVVKGHALVIPKVQVDYIFDLEDAWLSGLHLFSKKVAKGVQQIVPCQRIAVAVLGLEVPHAHVHLLPVQSEKDIDFTRARLPYVPEDFEALAQQISAVIASDQ